MDKVRCTGCKKSEDEVAAILAFPGNWSICDECLINMVEILANERKDWRDRVVTMLTEMDAR